MASDIEFDEDDNDDNFEIERLPALRPSAPVKRTAKQVAGDARLMQRVLQEVMRDGTHYGMIPGCAKPVLFKAGAEKILSTFMIAVTPKITNQSTEDEIRYTIQARGHHMSTGILVGVGVGECSTNEAKYKWRQAVCEEEWNDTPEDRRRTHYDRKGERYQQVRQEPADLANTVLKMAKKRAIVDLCLTATAASDLFAQDLDDEGNLIPKDEQPRAAYSKPKSASAQTVAATGAATEGQIRLLKMKLEKSGKDLEDLKEKFSVSGIESIQKSQVNEVLAWIG